MKVYENPLTHDPRDRIPKRCAGKFTMRLVATTGVENKEIPGGLNGTEGAPK
jgi:hypothetical protein